MWNRSAHALLLSAGIALLAACAQHSAREPASGGTFAFGVDWAKRQIAGFEAGTEDGRAVDGKVIFRGKPLYLIHSPCCDRLNYLYTADGRAFCAPSGGFTGGGDGTCPAGLGPVSRGDRR
jgi:hypothetical protein